MKKSYLNICFVGFILIVFACIQDSNRYNQVWHTLEEAQEKVAKTNKKIMLNVYTDDCDESRQLHEEVLPNPAVVETLNKYYCSVQINANSYDSLIFNGVKRTEKRIAEILGVTTYPTMVVLNSTGKKIVTTSGFMEAETFTNILSYIGSDAYLTTEYDLYVK